MFTKKMVIGWAINAAVNYIIYRITVRAIANIDIGGDYQEWYNIGYRDGWDACMRPDEEHKVIIANFVERA